MRPVVITSPSSNSGKTEFACRILRAFAPLQALKITRFHREANCPVHGVNEHNDDHCDGCSPVEDGFELVTERRRLDVAGKDTQRLLAAGGEPVVWLRAAPPVFSHAMRRGLDRLDRARPILIEGNSAASLDWLQAMIVVLWPQHPRGVKASVLPALRRCEMLLCVEAPESPRRRLPRTLRESCGRAGRPLERIPEVEWLPDRWWERPGDDLSGLMARLTPELRASVSQKAG